MKEIITYLTFDGNCRDAMTFYAKCLQAELHIMPFSETNNRVMHARLTKGTGVLMASDTMAGMPFTQGDNFSISIGCESVAEQDALFGALSAGGKITMPLQDTFWNARFGMLADQFGINWMFNFDKPKQE
jgi:PhnB protein